MLLLYISIFIPLKNYGLKIVVVMSQYRQILDQVLKSLIMGSTYDWATVVPHLSQGEEKERV